MRGVRSLSRLLIVALLGVVLVGGSVSGWLAYRSGLIEAGELFDAKLAHSARVLRGLVDAAFDAGEPAQSLEIAVLDADLSGRGAALATVDGHAYETKLAFQVWGADGRLLLRSANAPRLPLAPLRPGFAEAELDGIQWRSFVLAADSGRWYLAGEREDIRGEIATDIAAGILAPLLIELPISALLICLVVRYGRAALRRVTAEVATRAVGHLQPIDTRDVPEETANLVRAINRLLAELDAALARERRFSADAAHELRTPLAALRVHLGNLSEAESAAARAAAEHAMRRGLGRLDRLVEQLLTLSRLEPDTLRPPGQPVDLAALARDTLAEFLDATAAAGHELELHCEGNLELHGDPLGLRCLLRNLVENAWRYTPQPGRIRVGLVDAGATIVLSVEDSGPGIDPALRERVFDRFFRELGSAVEGSGLGLSIVRRVATIHAAKVELGRSERLGGLLARVVLPRRLPHVEPVEA